MIARGIVPTLAAAILLTAAWHLPPLKSRRRWRRCRRSTRRRSARATSSRRCASRGNRKTERSLIAGELAALGLAPGRDVDASDRRVETARYRLLSLGYFLDVHLSVARGSRRGAVVLIVDVEERGTLVINEIFAATSPATFFWGGTDLAQTNFMGRGINLGAGFVASTQPLVANAHAGLGLRLHVAVPPLGGPERRRAVGHRALQRRQRVLPSLGRRRRQRSRAVRRHARPPDRRRADGRAAVARQLSRVDLVPPGARLCPAAGAGGPDAARRRGRFRSTS